MRLILLILIASCGLFAQDKLVFLDGVQYVANLPMGCSYWILTNDYQDAGQRYVNREDCNDPLFKRGLEVLNAFRYTQPMTVDGSGGYHNPNFPDGAAELPTEDCCVRFSQGWVAKALVTIPDDQRAVYKEKLTKYYAQLAVEAKARAAEEAAKVADRVRVEANCRAVYRRTIDKKQGDLTVRETQQITACEALDMYHK